VKGFTLRKTRYLGIAMIISVLVAASINILYGLAVFSLHPSLSAMKTSQIPALYLANTYLGPGQQLLTAVVFLIATITTFVPAFVAASRHLGALAEDEYVPRSIANVSWVFTLAAIFILAVGNADFLINITDFLVLISLGIITLSALSLRRSEKKGRVLPVVVGFSCFVTGAGIYFIDSSVAIFGIAAFAITYLLFDISELGVFGTQLFLCVLDLSCIVLLLLFGRGTNPVGFLLSSVGIQPAQAIPALSVLLLISSATLASNLIVDIRVLRRSRNY
jgi:amino acid transporter